MKPISTFVITFMLLANSSFELRAQDTLFVEVDGHIMEALVKGEGQPIVVFDAGGGIDLNTWTKIQDAISEETTTISFSREGLGNSEAASRSHSVVELVSDLELLLQKLELPGPFVMVGHSLGGLYSRTFAAQNADRIAGLAIVDGTHARQSLDWGRIDSTLLSFLEQRQAMRDSLEQADGYAPHDLNAFVETQTSGVFEQAWPLPDVPTVVFTGMRDRTIEEWGPKAYELGQVARRLHSEYLMYTSDGIHIVTGKSGHFVHKDEPDLVIDNLKRIIERSRR